MGFNSKQDPQVGWDAERTALDTLGYAAPLPLGDPARAAAVLQRNRDNKAYVKNPHTNQAEVRHLLADPDLVARVNTLCGPNLRLWRSAFFSKSEGSGEIGWHHDKHFHSAGDDDIRLERIGDHFSVLFGLTDIVQTTGQIELIPGTHRQTADLERDTRPYHQRPASEHILGNLPASLLQGRRGVPIPANCFMLFHSAILHRSLEHLGGAPRLGLAIRLVREDLEIPRALAAEEDIMTFPPPA